MYEGEARATILTLSMSGDGHCFTLVEECGSDERTEDNNDAPASPSNGRNEPQAPPGGNNGPEGRPLDPVDPRLPQYAPR